jgi:4-amino-4-deoxy-L-arabinose transferase-like glycosyltransferase
VTAQGNPSRGGHRIVLAAMLLLALGVRLAWALSRPTSDAALNLLPDQHDYLSLARSVLHGDGFVFRDPRFPDELKAFRTPGYPIFLAACGTNVRVARAVQALIDTSTVLAVYCIARKMSGNRSKTVGAIAAALVAFNPFLIYFSGLLLTETLFTAMLAWSMLLLLKSADRRLLFLVAGLLLTTSILIRPSGIGLPVMLGITFMLTRQTQARPAAYEGDRKRRHAALAPLAMLLLTLLTLLPWAVRNRAVVGRWVPLDTNSGFTLYDGFNPAATGASDQTFVRWMPELQNMNELQRSDYLASLVRRYIVEHPGRVILLAFLKLARTWSPITLSSEYGQLKYQLIAAAYAVPFDLLVIIGLFCCGLSRGSKAFLLTPAVYFSIVHALTVGSLRYRTPAEPPLAILAALAAVTLVQKMRNRSISTTDARGAQP